MEIGRTNELVVLTPSDVQWIERALDLTNGRGDAMAREALQQGAGRSLACCFREHDGAQCGKAATHWARTDDGTLKGYCQQHWAEMDPNDSLGLNERPSETGDDAE